MKKSMKVCLILGVVFTFVGIGITVSAAAMGARINGFPYQLGMDYIYKFESSVSEMQNSGESSVFYDIKTLELDVDEGYVEILEAAEGTPDNEITVYSDSPYARVKIEQSSTTLKIKSEVKKKVFHWNREPSRIQVVVPKGYEFYKTDMDFGAVECQVAFLNTEKLEMDAGVGKVSINDARIGIMDAEGGVGMIEFRGEISGNASIENGVGSMNFWLTGAQEDFNYEIECGIGTVTIGGSNYSGLAREKRIDNQVTRWIDIDCGVGSVNIQFEE